MTYTFGLDTFGDRNGGADGQPLSHAQTIRNVVEEGVFAEQAGVDFFGIGEHHTDYFPMPAGDVALAAIAASTTSPAGIGKSPVWCSPMPKKSTPTWSASTPCSTTLRIVCA